MLKIKVRRRPEEAEIIIIPMIDTMMFLLMFFIVASLAMAVQNGLPVNLPKASMSVKHSSQNITITIAADGQLHLNTKPIVLANEVSELQQLHVTPDTLVIINGDARALHGIVTSAMDNASKAGVQHFAIATSS